MPFNIGETIGSYRLLEQLGQGGMATVFKAYHAALDRYVAIKALHPAFTEDPNFLARFQREAKVVARLEHPNIVPIYDFSEHGGRPFLVMKYIEGETLKARMSRNAISTGEMLNIIDAIGAALSYAHQQGILHRDIKPSNVMLARDGQIYLADFGLARIASAGESTLSSDMMLGTPQYISPEQALGKRDLDAGTDIYSFGVLLYEMFVGKVPFSADTPYAIIHDHIYSPLPLPRAVNPHVPEAVERVLLKALSKERADRYPDVTAMLGALKAALASPGIPVPPAAIEDDFTRVAASSKAGESIPQATTASAGVRTDLAGESEPVAATSPVGKPPLAVPAKKNKRWLLAIPVFLVLCLCIFAIGKGIQEEQQKQTAAAPAPTLAQANTNQAVKAAQQRVEQNPDDPYAHLELAMAYLDAGMPEDARREAEQASTLANDDPQIFIEAGKQLGMREAWPAAAQAFLAAYRLSSPPPQELIDLTREAIFKAYRAPEAPRELPIADIQAVDPVMAGIARALMQLNADDPAQAEITIRGVLRDNPGLAEARLAQAEILLRQDRAVMARPILDELSQDEAIPAWVREEAARMRK